MTAAPTRRGSGTRPGGGAAAVLRAVGLTAATVLLVGVLAVAAAAVAVPKLAGAVPVAVLSDSMAPTMPVGSLAVVRPTMPTTDDDATSLTPEQVDAVNDVAGIRVGDVIVFVPEEGGTRAVIHRVVGVSVSQDGSRVFTTQGDNNSGVDDPVPGHQVRAVLWYHLPWLGWVDDAMDSTARAWVGGTAAALGYAWAATHLWRAVRPRRPEPAPEAAGPGE